MSKKSFILMRDLLETVGLMSDDEAGKLLKAIINHVDKKEISLPREIMFAFKPIQCQLDRDEEKYNNFVEKQRLNGKKGGRPPKTQANPKNPGLILETQANPKNLDTDTDTDTDTDINIITSLSPKADPVPYQRIIDLYHKMLPDLPRCSKLTAKRKAQIRQRWSEDLKEVSHWENYFDYISQSDFLMGRVAPADGRKLFRADIEWLTNQSNYAKVAEEKYHG